MNLPFVLDVVLGLILLYLILSLLSSEIQELIATLLQWRAAHLKKSIQALLSGNETTDETLYRSRRILDELYANPLIQNISHQSRGGIETALRQIVRSIVTLGRKKNLTLQGNEPSYIPAETFATTLLEKLQLSQLANDLTALKLQILIERDILAGIQNSFKAHLGQEDTPLTEEVRSSLKRDFTNLKTTFNEILTAFKSGKISLQTSVYRLKSELNNYILSTSARLQSQEESTPGSTSADHSLLWQLGSLQQGIFYDDETADYDNITEVIRRLQPTLAEILEVFQIDASSAYEQHEPFAQIYQKIRHKAQEIAQDLPLPVQQSLAVLARRAEINLQRPKDQAVELLQDELQQFKAEIQNWFDRSMERASGVYKRNAKGVGFLIGLTLAIALNADTFHIATRLTTDATLRDALISSAEVISSRCNLPTQPRQIPPAASSSVPSSEQPAAPVSPVPAPITSPAAEQPAARLPDSLLPLTQPALAQVPPDAAPATPAAPAAPVTPVTPPLPETCITDAIQRTTELPLGWNQENLTQQATEAHRSVIPLPSPLRKLTGWVLTGLAIAMGASFWFDLLSKVVNVRNTGKRPDSKVDQAPPSQG